MTNTPTNLFNFNQLKSSDELAKDHISWMIVFYLVGSVLDIIYAEDFWLITEIILLNG